MTGVLVSVQTPNIPTHQTMEYLDELSLLAQTAGIQASTRFVQRLPHPDSKTFVGKGKLEEIKNYAVQQAIRYVLFDDDLTPSQLRNIEKVLRVDADQPAIQVYDRSLLILIIFQMRAQTTQAQAQVELAMNEYMLPRLTRLWSHLERQRGGTGTRGGAGEKEIETDRRMIRHRIQVLKKQLTKIDKQRFTQRKNRENKIHVALVGYTNAGKSTIMNQLTGARVKAENQLFATLDTTMRRVDRVDTSYLLSDTVGFVRKLPHHLIESFKSTLDEVRQANILLHVADLSHPFYENHIDTVNQTLVDIQARHKPTLLVLNKIDQCKKVIQKQVLQQYYKQMGFTHVIFHSALHHQDRPILQHAVLSCVNQEKKRVWLPKS